MKINQTRNYLKHGILLFGIFLIFYSCQKDEILIDGNTTSGETNPFGLINPSDVTTGTLNWNEFTRKTSLTNQSQVFQSFIIGNTNISNSNSQTTTNSDSTNEQLSVDQIQMFQYDGVTTYTFIIVENNDNDSFRNLIIRTEDDVEYDAYIAIYTPTEDWLNSDQDSTPYQGQVIMFPYTGTYQTNSDSTVDCYFTIEAVWRCDFDKNHPPGYPNCNGGNELISINIIEHCTFGTFGGSTNNNNTGNGDGDEDPYGSGAGSGNGETNGGNTGNNQTTNGNNLPIDGVMTKPIKGSISDPHINDLLKITSIPKVETELNRLKNNMGFTTQEDGKRFIYTGNDINNTNTYINSNFNQQSPSIRESDALKFPPLQNKTLIGAHYHPPLDDSSPPRPIRKVPSGTDIAEHIVMVKKIAETDPTIPTHTNQVTNFVVSKGTSGKTYAIRTNNEQDVVDLDGDFEIDGIERKKLAEGITKLILPIPVSDTGSQEQAISAYLTVNYPSISIYVAVYNPAGEITTWTKL